MTRRTSDAAVCSSSASSRSWASRATSFSSATDDVLERRFDLRRIAAELGFGVLGRRRFSRFAACFGAPVHRDPRRLRGIVAGRRPTLEVAYSCSSNKPL